MSDRNLSLEEFVEVRNRIGGSDWDINDPTMRQLYVKYHEGWYHSYADWYMFDYTNPIVEAERLKRVTMIKEVMEM